MRKLSIVVCLMAVLLLVSTSYAELFNRGTDSLGNLLIYDDDLNITWYDYSNSRAWWQNQVDWAAALTVNFDGTIYDDWRLPSTVDGPYVLGYDGSTTGGYNITSSEMGHLFYTELGNQGAYDHEGNPTSCYSSYQCLTNTGDFQNLQSARYWSATTFVENTNAAWQFSLFYGEQYRYSKSGGVISSVYAIAVRPGDVSVAVAPEPISSILFITGGTLLAGRRYLR